MKAIAILGSTGSVGVTTLDLIERFRDRFEVAALAAGRNLERLAEQVRRFQPRMVSVADAECATRLRGLVGSGTVRIVHGIEGAEEVATCDGASLVVSAMVGALGLRPTLAAIRAGKDIAFANKEVLVVAGAIVTRAARQSGAHLIPVDSEHNAIFQCLEGRNPATLKRIILTASGGPFLRLAHERFAKVSVAEALRHPTWQMGSKITIDSATLMNKGLEVIEAHWLFALPPERISVLIHPQSIVHSMVELVDGSVIAEMAVPDMAIPIAYALAYPERVPLDHLKPFSLAEHRELTFEEPDHERFPCLQLAYEALAAGGTMPACLSAANEVLVAAFLDGRVGFTDIARHIEAVMSAHRAAEPRSLEDVLEVDGWARAEAARLAGLDGAGRNG